MAPQEVEIQRNVQGVVRALMAIDRMTDADLGALLGCNRSAASMKLRGDRRFTLEEVVLMASHWGLDLERFVQGPYALLHLAASPDHTFNTAHRKGRVTRRTCRMRGPSWPASHRTKDKYGTMPDTVGT